MTLEEYQQKLKKHDWHYSYSDDHSVYQRGERELIELLKIASNGGIEFKRAFNEAEASQYPVKDFPKYKLHFEID